jgi:hypothetical protein
MLMPRTFDTIPTMFSGTMENNTGRGKKKGKKTRPPNHGGASAEGKTRPEKKNDWVLSLSLNEYVYEWKNSGLFFKKKYPAANDPSTALHFWGLERGMGFVSGWQCIWTKT